MRPALSLCAPNKVHASNIIRPMQTRIYRKKYTFYVIKSLEHLKNLKTSHVPYLGLELTNDHSCHQKPNPSRETIPLNWEANVSKSKNYWTMEKGAMLTKYAYILMIQ